MRHTYLSRQYADHQQVNQQHTQANADQGMRTVVLPSLLVQNSGRHDSADPGPVKHYVQDNGDREDAERREQRLGPVERR